MGTDQETVEKSAIEAKSDSIRQEYTFAPDVKLKECRYCRVMIPEKAKICPNCKTTLKSHIFIKMIAAVLVLAVAAAGCYGLFIYRESLPGSTLTALKEQDDTPVPDVSVNTVETTETAAGAKTVEPTEVANTALMSELEQNAPTEPAQTERFAGIGEVQNEEAGFTAENIRINDEAVTEDRAEAEDETEPEEEKTAEDTSDKEDQDDSEDRNAVGDKDTAKTEETKQMEETEEIEEAGKTEETKETKETEEGDPATVLKDIDENMAAFRADCEQRKYKSLLRDEEYLETAVLVTEAEVVCQVDGGLFDENTYYLCKGNEDGNECYYIIRDDRVEDETLILEGDIITVYGRLFGNCKIPANMIETRPTVPAISMVTYDLLGE